MEAPFALASPAQTAMSTRFRNLSEVDRSWATAAIGFAVSGSGTETDEDAPLLLLVMIVVDVDVDVVVVGKVGR